MALGIAEAYGAVRGAVGAISANQTKKRNRGIIGKAYQAGRKRLDLTQGDTRQSVAESLTARGLAQGGNVRLGGPVSFEGQNTTQMTPGRAASPLTQLPSSVGGMGGMARTRIQQAFAPRPQTGFVPHRLKEGEGTVDVTQATDLGGQQTADLAREQQLEQNDLRMAYENAYDTNNANALNEQLGSIAQGIEGAYGLYNAMQLGKPPTPYASAWGGIDPVQPLDRGAWAQPESTSEFNVFGKTSQRQR